MFVIGGNGVQRLAVSTEGITHLSNGPSLPYKAYNSRQSSTIVNPTGTYIYVSNADYSSRKVSRLGVETSTWSNLPGLTVGRRSGSAFMLGDTLYAVGGYTAISTLSSMEFLKLNEPGATWKLTNVSLPTAVGGMATCVMDSWVWLSGGDPRGPNLRSLLRWKPPKETWEEMAPMKYGRFSHSMVTDGSRLYAIGGYASSRYLSSMEMYDPNTNSWSELAALPRGRSSFSAVFLPWGQGQILIPGGRLWSGTSGLTNTILRYSISNNTWTQSDVILQKTAHGAGAVIIP